MDMLIKCPYCQCVESKSESHKSIIRKGSFQRKSDKKRIKRFYCVLCKKQFSLATYNAFYHQNKRAINHSLSLLLSSGVSQRRAAKILKISRTTVARKLKVLGSISLHTLHESNLKSPKKTLILEFDDMETFEHSKCKPLSITLAVDKETRRILAFEVSRMAAKGLLTKKAFKKYGYRKDERSSARDRFFQKLAPLVHERALIKSDENPHYVDDVRKYFPNANHERHKGQRGALIGQGELKKIRFDPLFSINHTCAMLRANVNRLFRKTWCTTKKAQNLTYHIAIYSVFHNFQLIESS